MQNYLQGQQYNSHKVAFVVSIRRERFVYSLVCWCVGVCCKGSYPFFFLIQRCAVLLRVRGKKYNSKLHDFLISTENKEMTLVPGLKLERNRWWCTTIEACLNLKQIAKLEQLKIFKVSYLALIFFLPGTSEPPYSNVAY